MIQLLSILRRLEMVADLIKSYVKTISKLKKELDKWFSLYIRLRNATDEGLCKVLHIRQSKVSL